MEVIALTAPELKGIDADQFEIIGTKSIFRLAQRPASRVEELTPRAWKEKVADQPL